MENTPIEIPARVTPKQAAEILGIKRQSIYDAIIRGTLKAKKPKSSRDGYMIAREDLIDYRARTQPNGVKQLGRPKKEATP